MSKMVKIEASSLEEAYTQASRELECSITDIDFEIVQYPSKGFLGFGKKSAILVAIHKTGFKKQEANTPKHQQTHQKQGNKAEKKGEKQTKKEPVAANLTVDEGVFLQDTQTTKETVEPKKTYVTKTQIDDNFFKEKKEIGEVCEEIENDINALFAASCFKLDKVRAEPHGEESVLITFSGADSALLIGKEGYRYKALSYLLFNWINSKYDLLIRLEIAEFLKNQEEMVANYLEPLIDNIRHSRKGQTKVLDGVLIQIALKILREEFDDLYVGVKTNEDGSKYIIVNEFYSKQNVK